MKPGLADQAASPKSARLRRFWSAEEKRRIVAESFTPGARASKVAQRHGVNANLLFTWRRQQARSAASGGEPLEVPIRVEDDRAPASVAALEPVGRMEIVLAAGERIVVGADVDAAALARVVKALLRR
jgi:transposase